MILIQARLDSERLPNKILLDVGRQSMLEAVIGVCSQVSELSKICLALPQDSKHFALGKWASELWPDLKVSYGDADDVFSRMSKAYAYMLGNDDPDLREPVLRVCADRPIMEYRFLSWITENVSPMELCFNHDPGPLSGPTGLGAEALGSVLANRFFLGDLRHLGHKEHVTLNLYGSRLINKTYGLPQDTPTWIRNDTNSYHIDTWPDYWKIREIVDSLGNVPNLFSYPLAPWSL